MYEKIDVMRDREQYGILVFHPKIKSFDQGHVDGALSVFSTNQCRHSLSRVLQQTREAMFDVCVPSN